MFPNISYYRDKEKNEIDLVFYKNNRLYPFEIKKTASPMQEMVKNFRLLEATKKEIGSGGVICFADRRMHLTEKDLSLPIGDVIDS